MLAWVKYGLRGDALERALDALEPFLLSEPLRAFALAAQLDEPKLMKLAARACLFLPNLWNIDVAELENIGVNTYRRLLKYQDAAVSKVTELEGLACREFAFGEPNGSSELFSRNAAQCTLARKPSEYDAGQCQRLLKKIASNPRSIQRAGAFGFPLELLFTGYRYKVEVGGSEPSHDLF